RAAARDRAPLGRGDAPGLGYVRGERARAGDGRRRRGQRGRRGGLPPRRRAAARRVPQGPTHRRTARAHPRQRMRTQMTEAPADTPTRDDDDRLHEPAPAPGLLDRLGSLAIGIAALSLAGLVVVQGWQVVARYVFNNSPSWTEPVTLLLLSTAMSLGRSEEHTSELQSRENLVCRLL